MFVPACAGMDAFGTFKLDAHSRTCGNGVWVRCAITHMRDWDMGHLSLPSTFPHMREWSLGQMRNGAHA